MPGHHSLSLHYRESSDDLIVCVAGMKAHYIMSAAKSFIAAGQSMQLPVLAHLVAVEMSPYLLLSPSAVGAKMCVYIRRYRNHPECHRVEPQFILHDTRTILMKRVFNRRTRNVSATVDPKR